MLFIIPSLLYLPLGFAFSPALRPSVIHSSFPTRRLPGAATLRQALLRAGRRNCRCAIDRRRHRLSFVQACAPVEISQSSSSVHRMCRDATHIWTRGIISGLREGGLDFAGVRERFYGELCRLSVGCVAAMRGCNEPESAPVCLALVVEARECKAVAFDSAFYFFLGGGSGLTLSVACAFMLCARA